MDCLEGNVRRLTGASVRFALVTMTLLEGSRTDSQRLFASQQQSIDDDPQLGWQSFERKGLFLAMPMLIDHETKLET